MSNCGWLWMVLWWFEAVGPQTVQVHMELIVEDAQLSARNRGCRVNWTGHLGVCSVSTWRCRLVLDPEECSIVLGNFMQFHAICKWQFCILLILLIFYGFVPGACSSSAQLRHRAAEMYLTESEIQCQRHEDLSFATPGRFSPHISFPTKVFFKQKLGFLVCPLQTGLLCWVLTLSIVYLLCIYVLSAAQVCRVCSLYPAPVPWVYDGRNRCKILTGGPHPCWRQAFMRLQ